MKEYVIVRHEHVNAFSLPRVTRADTGVVYGMEQSEIRNYQDYNANVYFADTMNDAINLANRLSEYNLGASFLVAKTTDVLYRPVPPVVHSKLTEKGLLPV